MAEDRTGGAKPVAAAPADPSMEDILASIRRILNEDEAQAVPAPPPTAAPAADVTMEAPAEEPLDLTEDMLVEEPVAAQAEPEPPPPVATVEPPPPPPPPAPVQAEPAPPPVDQSLLAPAVAAAATASVGSLLRAVAADRSAAVHRGGPTIEDVVREELRPLLKEWLDSNLPALVERLVRSEIERVVGRALS